MEPEWDVPPFELPWPELWLWEPDFEPLLEPGAAVFRGATHLVQIVEVMVSKTVEVERSVWTTWLPADVIV